MEKVPALDVRKTSRQSNSFFHTVRVYPVYSLCCCCHGCHCICASLMAIPLIPFSSHLFTRRVCAVFVPFHRRFSHAHARVSRHEQEQQKRPATLPPASCLVPATDPDQTLLLSHSAVVDDSCEGDNHQREQRYAPLPSKTHRLKKKNDGSRVESLRMSNRREDWAEEEEVAVFFYRRRARNQGRSK